MKDNKLRAFLNERGIIYDVDTLNGFPRYNDKQAKDSLLVSRVAQLTEENKKLNLTIEAVIQLLGIKRDKFDGLVLGKSKVDFNEI
jgi:hypothetical protein